MKGELHLPDLPEVPVALSPLSSPGVFFAISQVPSARPTISISGR